MINSWACVDASLVVRLIAGPNSAAVRSLWDQWDAANRRVAAPSLIYYEVTNALYRSQRAGLISMASVRLSLQTALALPIHLHAESDLHQEALELAAQLSLPAAYDAHYLALAARLGAEFWTADRRLVNTVQSVLTWVRFVGS